MIDPEWFEAVATLGEADLAGFDRDRLPGLLADMSEALPFLVVRADGFADWPKARAALRQAVREFPRARDVRPQAAGAAGPSPQRRTLYEGMRRTLVGNDVHWRPDWEERGIHIDDLLEAITAVRRDERRGDDTPSMFIERG